jgi:hypothetical protein
MANERTNRSILLNPDDNIFHERNTDFNIVYVRSFWSTLSDTL